MPGNLCFAAEVICTHAVSNTAQQTLNMLSTGVRTLMQDGTGGSRISQAGQDVQSQPAFCRQILPANSHSDIILEQALRSADAMCNTGQRHPQH